ncbi:MAG: hypothetical protein ABL912_05165 [Novosphingobium sp.]
MNALIFAPLLVGYAVADSATLSAPVLAADHCVQAIASGGFDETVFTADGWKLDSKPMEGSLKNAKLYLKQGAGGAVLVEPAKGGGMKCSFMYFGPETSYQVIEYQMAAHFNDRLFPLDAETIGYKVTGHKVAVFSTRRQLSKGPMLEILVVPHDPEEKTK